MGLGVLFLKRGRKTTAVGVQRAVLCVSAKMEGEGKAGARKAGEGVVGFPTEGVWYNCYVL